MLRTITPTWPPLCDSYWVKFVWVNACYSNVCIEGDIWENVTDMAKAFGMNCWENHYSFQDQSYIGFSNLTPVDYWDGWLMAVYAWIFWDYLSQYGAAVEPDFGVEQAWWNTQIEITLLIPQGWAAPLYYLSWFNKYSHPSLGAKLKCHLP